MASITNKVFRFVDGKVQKTPVELPPLKPNEVLLRITHSGLCHSDTFYIPHGIALGHEGVGIVEAIGEAVTELKIGDRAGGGYHRSSCGKCRFCLSGQEILCYSRDIFGEASFSSGTFADYYIGQETYLHKIPTNMSSADAAPLQCAGATVYSALIEVVKPGLRVGVIGIGGLGHLAIQFAHHLGADVVVFSTSAEKEGEAKGWGAGEFWTLNDVGEKGLTSPVDVLVLTGNKHPDFNKFMTKEMLSRGGTVVPLTASGAAMELPSMSVFFNVYHIHSNLVAGRKVHDDMLRFAAAHDIKPAVEEFKMDEEGWTKALDKLHSGSLRYRAVLVNEKD